MNSEIYGEMIKSLSYIKRNKVIAAMTFFPPLVLSIFTFSGDSHWVISVVNEDEPITDKNWSRKFIDILSSEKGTIPYYKIEIQDEETALNKFNLREIWAIVYIPEGFNQDLDKGNTSVEIIVKMNALHEDVSKNIRLGIEGRIYLFTTTYQLETGVHPGFIIKSDLLHETELPRADYMVSGLLVFSIIWFGFFIGATLGTTEKDHGTIIELKMAYNGIAHSHIGKILATIVISSILFILLFISLFIFRNGLPINLSSVITISLIFVILNTIFAVLGVSYGLRIGDFRGVPAPAILISLTLWILCGGINPIEIGAGFEIFQYIPSTAANQTLLIGIFARGSAKLIEATQILVIWFLLSITLFLLVQRIYRR
jgi:hypothetical protein